MRITPFPSLKQAEEAYPGWFKMGWKPVKRKTYNLYVEKRVPLEYQKDFGIVVTIGGEPGRYGFIYRLFKIRIPFGRDVLVFWIKWNIVCRKEISE